GDEARRPICPGSASSASSIASFRQSRHYIRCPVTASTPKPEGGARCVSSARRDLGGGRGAILVPTATVRNCCRWKPLGLLSRPLIAPRYPPGRPQSLQRDGSGPASQHELRAIHSMSG